VSEHTFALIERDADKSLRLKLPVKVANGRRPSPACSPRNAFRNFMLIWLVTLDQRQTRKRGCERTRGLDSMKRDTWRRQWRFSLSTVHCPPHRRRLPSSVLSTSRLTEKRQMTDRFCDIRVAHHPLLLSTRVYLAPRSSFVQKSLNVVTGIGKRNFRKYRNYTLF